jgi:type I restriction enzyme S subunit
MTALLTDNLPLLAGAPNGIKKLRELILELAVRGKLVPQDPSDEPASELMKRILEEKALLVTEGKVKKQKSLAEIGEKEGSFDLPNGWFSARLMEIAALVTDGDHQPPPRAEEGVPFLVIGNLNSGNICFEGCRRVPEEYFDALDWGRRPARGDILYTVTGSFGIPVMVDVDAPFCVQRHVAIIKVSKSSPSAYLKVLLSSLYAKSYAESIATGIAQKTVPLTGLRQLVVPLPPSAEQHRIVAKVDELMALCDQMEARQTDAESAHAQLVQALLDSLTQVSDATDFSSSWQRLSEHFHTLFTNESSIDALKQTLLQLAVMGKLVSQDPNDEPASELLKCIAEEKVRLVAEGKVTKQKVFADTVEEEKPFVIPASWEWVRLGRLLKKIGAGSTPLGGRQAYVADGVKFLRSQNVWNEGLRLNGVAFISDEVHRKMLGTHVEAGDLLFNITGASIGRCAAVPSSFDTGNVSQHVTIVRPVFDNIQPFLHLVLISQLVQRAVMDVQVGVSREGLSIGKLAKFLIPFPPSAEQHRIVAKVDQLIALCDQLKASLVKARALNEQLAVAVVAATIAGKPATHPCNVIHLSSYLVRKLADQRTFGRTAHMKWLFLADQHLGLELGMTYERQAAGPLDTLIYQIEEQAAQAQFYAIQKEALKSGAEKIVYLPDAEIDRAADAGAAELGGKRAELDRLIGLLGSRKTDDLEIVATLYAVWNDALAEGLQPDDDWLINEFRTNWHKGKERFAPELLAQWLGWMRDYRLVPKGRNNSTRHQASLLH